MPQPVFPPELERGIFETCALSRPVLIPKLMLVAGRVELTSKNGSSHSSTAQSSCARLVQDCLSTTTQSLLSGNYSPPLTRSHPSYCATRCGTCTSSSNLLATRRSYLPVPASKTFKISSADGASTLSLTTTTSPAASYIKLGIFGTPLTTVIQPVSSIPFLGLDYRGKDIDDISNSECSAASRLGPTGLWSAS
ncbi:hypothetical protein FB45DRAFT_929768 [Roridomyces roridus]|uniref:Uncharacterized protein n=1 Tax=Roridomyces roridus TaxID=1738132 RepID=A0AAD7FF10_9AGAR|nr:hypothetical protein FB45DRAFT_929768 [Roridomyces roridus]